MNLRDYQKESINNTRLLFKQCKRVLTVLPCGAGKTVEFAYMASEHLKTHPFGYVWFIVHRKELIDQTIDTFDNNNIDRSNILIGMVQTMVHHINEYKKPTLIIFDEAHHASAGMWKTIIEAFPDVPMVGLTATPARMDGKPLGNIFEQMTVGITAKKLIKLGYLSKYQYYAPKINLEDAEWTVKGSDYDMSSVEESFDKAGIYGDVIKYINPDRKTIIYAPTLKYSKLIIEKINEHFGNIAVHFDGETPKKERTDIINRFRSGSIRVLSNVNLIGEGFDCPDCDTVILLRPTMSLSLYIQQSMRCMRPAKNKIAIIYDLVGNVFRHGLPDDDREWSLYKKIKHRNSNEVKDVLIRQCNNCFQVYSGTNPICPYCGFNNGKTQKQIKEEQDAELERIENLRKKAKRFERFQARTYEELVQYAIKNNMKNPRGWAYHVYYSRQKKI